MLYRKDPPPPREDPAKIFSILEVNRASVSSVADFDKAMRNVSNGATLLLVKRGENTFYIAVQK